jgi:hypothetical protein
VIADVDNRSLFGKSLHPGRGLGNANKSNRGINEGRQSAREVDLYLEQSTSLPVTGGIVKRTAQEILGRAERAPIQITATAN